MQVYASISPTSVKLLPRVHHLVLHQIRISFLSLSSSKSPATEKPTRMAEQRQNYGQIQPQQQQYPIDVIKRTLPDSSPSKSQILAALTLLPVGGTLLLLSGLTLAGTVIGLTITTPLFVIFSPVLVPAAIVIGLAVMGFLSSGAFGIIALAALSWMVNFQRKMGSTGSQPVEHVKRWVQDSAGQVGQKTKETGQTIQSKAQEANDERRDQP